MKNYILVIFFFIFIVVGVLMGLYFFFFMLVGGKLLCKVDLLVDICLDVEEEVCDFDIIVFFFFVKFIFVDICKMGIICIEDYLDFIMWGMKYFYEVFFKVKIMKCFVCIVYFGDFFIEVDIFIVDLCEMF